MAVAFRAASDGQNNSVTTHTCPIPTGVVSGDVLIMGINNYMNGSPINTPSGWTLAHNIGATTGPNAQRNFALYTRVADGTEGSTLTLTSPAAAYTHIQILAYSGGAGVDATAAIGAINTSTSPSFPSVTTTVANGVAVGVLLEIGSSGDTLAAPGGWTLRHTSSFFSTLNTKNYAVDLAMPAAGASGTASGTLTSIGAVAWSSFTVAVKGATAVAPVANFTGTPTSGTEPLSVTFTDTSTNTPTSWAWTFGDGGTSTSQNPTHSYTAAGTYTVVLVATNASGSDTKTRTGYIAVSDQPRPIRINTSQGWADIGDATSFVSGTGAPTAAVGATGAIYLDVSSGLRYGPKAAGAWPGTPIAYPASTPADATTSAKGIVQLAGDLAGTAAAPQVKAPYGTTPPGSPADGQLWFYPADATNGIVWMFRYNASGGTYKWEFVGGSAMRSVVATQENTTNTGSVALATAGPTVTAPRAGDYEVQFGGFGYNLTAGFGSVMTLYVNGVSTSVAAFGGTNFYTNVSKNTVVNAAGAGYGFTLLYSAQGGGTASFGDRWLWLRPVRVS